tara:strand:+ start:2290 stop:2886 length:597 start_codon:yes stop_codon:yes gene_type:complete
MTAFDQAFALLKMPPNLAGETLHHGKDDSRSMNHYMVHDDVWNEAQLAYEDNPTLDELEALLGRRLTVDDFTNAPINWDQGSKIEPLQWQSDFPHEYATMKDRIGGSEGVRSLKNSHLRETLLEDDHWKKYPGTLYYKLMGNHNMNYIDAFNMLSPEHQAHPDVQGTFEHFKNWVAGNPERHAELEEDRRLKNEGEWP